MKVSDFIFQFPAPSARQQYGICRVRVFITRHQVAQVLLTDLGSKSVGPSVTNAVELIAQSLVTEGYVPEDAHFFEHYMERVPTFDIVKIQKNTPTSWSSIDSVELAKLLECDVSEFAHSALLDSRLRNQIERLRHKLDPHRDFSYAQPDHVIKRRLEIESSMLSRGEVEAIISSGAGERELQQLLCRDLSLLGEMYASSSHEYICFSEYPIGKGFVDFVVFTGRSCMDVFLIEIKGADFNLVNSDSYQGFNAKINEAADQIRIRYREIFENLSQSRENFHSNRKTAESGKSIYRSFLGSDIPLEVDSNKSVNFYGVVIGGRTRIDLDESKKRADYRHNSTPSICIESWDTWVRKLQRN